MDGHVHDTSQAAIAGWSCFELGQNRRAANREAASQCPLKPYFGYIRQSRVRPHWLKLWLRRRNQKECDDPLQINRLGKHKLRRSLEAF